MTSISRHEVQVRHGLDPTHFIPHTPEVRTVLGTSISNETTVYEIYILIWKKKQFNLPSLEIQIIF